MHLSLTKSERYYKKIIEKNYTTRYYRTNDKQTPIKGIPANLTEYRKQTAPHLSGQKRRMMSGQHLKGGKKNPFLRQSATRQPKIWG